MSEGLRVDVLLHRLCLTKSRNEAKTACDTGAVALNGRPARPSDSASPGARLRITYPWRTLELELTELPGKSTSRRAAREMYHILHDERREPAE